MAEYRAYRNSADTGRKQKFLSFKRQVVVAFLAYLVAANWYVTQTTAAIVHYQAALKAASGSFYRIYPPWAWLIWWQKYGSRAHDFFLARDKLALYLIAPGAALAAIAIIIARHIMSDEAPDLHGSARWANSAEIQQTGFLASRRRWFRRHITAARDGIYLGMISRSKKSKFLKDCGIGHVLLFAPTRAGKGISTIIPTLTTWPHSTLIHDFKGELWHLTAGARKDMGQLVLKFDPTNTVDGVSVKFNPLEEVRLRSVHEAEDVQNIVRMIVDPDGKGLNDHWLKTGAALLTGAILHVLYVESNKTLRGVAGFLSDPKRTIDETLKVMLTTKHDTNNDQGWRDHHATPTTTHPLIAESVREVMNKSENERSGVLSTAMSFLEIYRNPVVAANTEYSEFRISDLVNNDRPVSLYLVVPIASRDRLRPLIRLMLNQIVRTLTSEPLEYDSDGRAHSPNRHKLLLMLDEFPLLGHMELFDEAAAHMAGYGLRACFVAQDLGQIKKYYGRDEAISSNCDTLVAFTPNKQETAEILSRQLGKTTVRYDYKRSGNIMNGSSEPEAARDLMTADEVRRLPTNAVIIITRGDHPILATMIRYFDHPYFKRLALIPPPGHSDRIITAPPPSGRENAQPSARETTMPAEANFGFLNFAKGKSS